MRPRLRALVLVILAVTCGLSAGLPSPARAQSPPPAASALRLSPEAIETFLLKARIGSTRSAGGGVTDSLRATLTDGALTHDAQIQSVDVSKARFEAGKASEVNFRDSFKYNIAAYRLSRLLGMDNVPVSVERRVDGKPAAVTWWLDDVAMDERERTAKRTMGPQPLRTSMQLQMMQVFDELIQNKDRNPGNVVWTSDWKLWLIDHTRAFRTGKELANPDELARCDRVFLQRLRQLTAKALNDAMRGALSAYEREALLARRDLLVKHYDERIARVGEASVLFEPTP
jgi:hypothetical protein